MHRIVKRKKSLFRMLKKLQKVGPQKACKNINCKKTQFFIDFIKYNTGKNFSTRTTFHLNIIITTEDE